MRKVKLFLTAIFFIATTAVTAQTDTLVRTKSNADKVRFWLQWTPNTAIVKANGVVLTHSTYDTIPVNGDSMVFITSEDSIASMYLDFHSNQLSQLDISKNTALIHLNCDNNQLTELDVTNNTALIELFCFDNQLNQLDVTKNTALWYLSCADNQLTELDVTNNTKLRQLDCSINQLTQLNVASNTALTWLECRNNQLSQLDVSKNIALERLYCFNNQLSQLDVSKNIALTRLECHSNQLSQLDVTNNTALEYIDCHSNQLSQLDITKNTVLWYLSCYNNQLSSLDLNNKSQLSYLYAENQAVEVAVSKGTATFPNPIYYHNKTVVEDVKISGIAYAFGASVSKPTGQNTVQFTTDRTIYGDAFGGIITFVTGNSIKNINTTAINIYPNPAQHTLYIESAEMVEQVSIYDISGRMLQQTNNPSTSIDVSGLANGIYLVKVKTTQGETVKKIVISV